MERGCDEAVVWDGRLVRVLRDAERSGPHLLGVDLRPVERSRRRGHVQGDPRARRQSAPRVAHVPPAARAGAARPRPPVLDRGPRLRPGVPRAAHRAAAPGRLATVLHPGRPPALAPARPQPAALGDVRHRGPRRHRRAPERQLRDHDQDPPRGGRRGDAARDHQRPQRPRPRCRRARADHRVAARAPPDAARAAVTGGHQHRRAADAHGSHDRRCGARRHGPDARAAGPPELRSRILHAGAANPFQRHRDDASGGRGAPVRSRHGQSDQERRARGDHQRRRHHRGRWRAA